MRTGKLISNYISYSLVCEYVCVCMYVWMCVMHLRAQMRKTEIEQLAAMRSLCHLRLTYYFIKLHSLRGRHAINEKSLSPAGRSCAVHLIVLNIMCN